jgi:hypothetical protein
LPDLRRPWSNIFRGQGGQPRFPSMGLVWHEDPRIGNTLSQFDRAPV